MSKSPSEEGAVGRSKARAPAKRGYFSVKMIAMAALILAILNGFAIKALERRADEAHLALLCVSLGGRPGIKIGEANECFGKDGKLWGAPPH